MASVFRVQETVPVPTEPTVHMEIMGHKNQNPLRNQRSQIDQLIILRKKLKNQKHPVNITIGQQKHRANITTDQQNRQDNQNQTTINQVNRRNRQITTNRRDHPNQRDQQITTNRTRNHQTFINQIKSRTKNRLIITNPKRNLTKR